MYQLISNGDVPDESYFNGLMKQTIITCTSGARPSSPVEGMTIYETDTDRLMRYNGTAWEYVGNQMVRKRVSDSLGGTIATTESIEKTLTLAIPATWATYDLDVWVMVRALETGVATGNTTVSMRVRKTNVAGVILGSTAQVLGDVAPSNLGSMAFGAMAEGETATGNIDLVFTASLNANNGLYSWADLTMTAYAWRLT